MEFDTLDHSINWSNMDMAGILPETSFSTFSNNSNINNNFSQQQNQQQQQFMFQDQKGYDFAYSNNNNNMTDEKTIGSVNPQQLLNELSITPSENIVDPLTTQLNTDFSPSTQYEISMKSPLTSFPSTSSSSSLDMSPDLMFSSAVPIAEEAEETQDSWGIPQKSKSEPSYISSNNNMNIDNGNFKFPRFKLPTTTLTYEAESNGFDALKMLDSIDTVELTKPIKSPILISQSFSQDDSSLFSAQFQGNSGSFLNDSQWQSPSQQQLSQQNQNQQQQPQSQSQSQTHSQGQMNGQVQQSPEVEFSWNGKFVEANRDQFHYHYHDDINKNSTNTSLLNSQHDFSGPTNSSRHNSLSLGIETPVSSISLDYDMSIHAKGLNHISSSNSHQIHLNNNNNNNISNKRRGSTSSISSVNSITAQSSATTASSVSSASASQKSKKTNPNYSQRGFRVCIR
ncbi:unnamed protein product [Ambrosiozyma monospora]|uniref:Unnamed protein product n=1 Tax=Ambrosiozyma monospora TaxID=43982 RepID=A0A9W6Z6K5_AMBMO|nr:unnamed protein product [Ambrosiozyma monospora]